METNIKLIVTICSYCKKIIGCCVSGSCVIQKDECKDCDTENCKIIYYSNYIKEEYKKLGADFPDERSIEDTVGNPVSHGACEACMDRVLTYFDGGNA